MTTITPVRTLAPVTPVTNVPAAAIAAPTAPVALPAAPVASTAVAQARQGATTSEANGRPGRQGKSQFDAAIKSALSKDPKASVAVDTKSNTATLVSGDFTFDVKPGAAGQPEDIVARAFFKEHGNLFGVSDAAAQLHLVQTSKDELGFHNFRYQQYYNDLPVFGQQLVVHTQEATVRSAGGHLVPGINLTHDENTTLKAADALKAIQASMTSKKAPTLKLEGEGTLGVYATNDGKPHLSYEMDVQSASGPESWRYYVDAQSGKVLDSWSTLE
ncbi:MAG: PepSY domain-containing protein, partial [Thermoleophilia bacterium]|nr:PepSY domain-containing protein [Thermoleophilia bacterium]